MPTVNGRDFQHATADLQIGGAGKGSTYVMDMFSKLAYKVGAEKKPVQNHKGKNVSYTIDPEKTEGGMTTTLAEWKAVKDFIAQQFPTLGIGQIELEMTVCYGNDPSNLMTDVVQFMFQEEGRNSENNQEVLMVDLPLFIFHVSPHGGDFIKYD